MGASERLLQPRALALYTRDREDDYRWVFEVGDGFLVNKLKELHRDLLADQDAQPAATFALLDDGPSLGLVVANLKTPRHDHLRTHIDDALLLEFEAVEREAVFRLTADLLGPDSAEIRRRLLDYAEARFQQKLQTGRIGAEALMVPSPSPLQPAAPWPKEVRVGFRSNEDNQRRVALLLHDGASNLRTPPRPFVVVSTGFVGKAKLQQHARACERFIALTRSSTFPDHEEASLQPAEGEKDTRGCSWSQRRTLLILVSGLVMAMLLGAWLLLENKGLGLAGSPSWAGHVKDLPESDKR